MAKAGSKTTYTRKGSGAGKVAEKYSHPEATSPMRPDVGTQAQFRKKKPPLSQAFFPRTGAWNDLRKALRRDSDLLSLDATSTSDG